MNKHHILKFALLYFSIFIIFSCTSDEAARQRDLTRAGTVKVRDANEPRGLNPYTNSDVTGFVIKQLIFQRLLDFDYDTYELVPVLAESRPEIILEGDSLLQMTFTIRPEAKWDNGAPVTTEDIAFSFKTVVAPGVDDEALRPYLDFIDDIILYPDEPRKITFVSDQPYMRAETTIGYDIQILPAYIYDPDGALERYTFKEIKEDSAAANDPAVKAFVEKFNSPFFSRDVANIIGSGPYIAEDWVTDQRIILKRKDNWWGDSVTENLNMYFEAHPDRIIHEIINDPIAAVTALKGGQIDVMRSITPSEFKEDLTQNERFKEKYNLHTPPMFGYSFIGLNTGNPLLQDEKTRQALAHLVNYDRLMEDIIFGYGQRVVGPVHPEQEKFYNNELKPYKYNPEKAMQLLNQAGWADNNHNGILDKMINGKLTEFSLEYMYNSGNKDREKVGLILQEDARKAGIEIKPKAIDWSIMLEKMSKHDFDMFYSAWLGEPAPEDYTQLWHTSSSNGGSNFVNFGNAATDALIEKINKTLDEEKRANLVKEFQEILFRQVPYIFLWSPQNKIAISNRFENTHPSAYRPGYYIPAFTLKEKSQQ